MRLGERFRKSKALAFQRMRLNLMTMPVIKMIIGAFLDMFLCLVGEQLLEVQGNNQ
jgi:hypothetical protein